MGSRRLRVAMTLEQCWHRVPGGTAVAAIELARELRNACDLDLVGVSAGHRRLPPPQWRPPVSIRRLPLPRALLYESWHVLRRPRVERATGPVDVIHATGVAMPPRSAPIVLTVHDLAFRRFPEHFTRPGLRFFEQSVRLARTDADLVLCSSLATVAACRAAGFDDERLRHVPLGVDSSPSGPADVERVRTAYGLARPYVLWTGTVEPRKNLAGLLAAFELLEADVDLVLVGPKGWNEDLQARLAGMSRRSRVRVLGFVPRDDRDALYAGAAAFCFPSLLEGFGFPVLEAMAQGAPVVTSRGTSTEELADGAGIVVDPREPGEIAAAVDRVLADDALAERLRAAGPARAADYTWTRTAELVEGAYRDAARQ